METGEVGVPFTSAGESSGCLGRTEGTLGGAEELLSLSATTSWTGSFAEDLPPSAVFDLSATKGDSGAFGSTSKALSLSLVGPSTVGVLGSSSFASAPFFLVFFLTFLTFGSLGSSVGPSSTVASAAFASSTGASAFFFFFFPFVPASAPVPLASATSSFTSCVSFSSLGAPSSFTGSSSFTSPPAATFSASPVASLSPAPFAMIVASPALSPREGSAAGVTPCAPASVFVSISVGI